MEKLEFRASIDAPREKVWKVLWDDASYQAWTSVFAEGSRAETDWNKGSKVLFTDGKGEGMVSMIADKIPNEFMSIKHLGVLKGGVEDLTNEWSGALENYTLKNADGKTELKVEMDSVEEFKKYFTDTWPKALEKVKALAEE